MNKIYNKVSNICMNLLGLNRSSSTSLPWKVLPSTMPESLIVSSDICTGLSLENIAKYSAHFESNFRETIVEAKESLDEIKTLPLKAQTHSLLLTTQRKKVSHSSQFSHYQRTWINWNSKSSSFRIFWARQINGWLLASHWSNFNEEKKRTFNCIG